MQLLSQNKNSLSRFGASVYSNNYSLPLMVFILTLFGYPIIGNLVSILQIESRLLTIPFRIFIILLSLLVIITTRSFRFNPWHIALFFFWAAYFLRLAYDNIYTKIPDASYALLFFIASCVIPAIAVMKSRNYEEYSYAKYSLLLATAGGLMSIAWRFIDTSGSQQELTIGRLSEVALNPITIGNLGVSAILCGISVFTHTRNKIIWFMLLSISIAISLSCIVLAESKGPVLALVTCLIIWGLANKKIYSTLSVICISVLSYFLLVFNIESGTRISTFLVDPLSQESTQIRLTLIEDALKQINNSPFIGSAFVELNSQQYPHNFLIEAALATGVPFAILLFIIISKGILNAWKSLESGDSLLALLYFQALIGSMVSGALFGAPMLWITLVLLLYRQKP